MIILKKLDLINSKQQTSSLKFENVVFKFNIIKCSEYINSFVFTNCRFEKGLRIEGLTSGSHIQFENCEFLHQTGLNIADCQFHTLSLRRCYMTGSEGDYFDISTSILSKTILIDKSIIETINVIHSNFNFESYNSKFRKKFRFYISEPSTENPQAVTVSEEQLSEFYLYFGSTIFDRAEVDIRVATIKRISFEQIDDRNSHNDQLEIHQEGMLSIKSNLIKNIFIKNVSFTCSYIDLENVPVQVFEASSAVLGSTFNFSINKLIDEQSRKVVALEIIDCTLKESRFSGREFDRRLDFSDTFFTSPPIFYETKIPEGSIFPNSLHFDVEGKIEYINAFRYLRKVMEERRDRELEGEFFLLEQDSKFLLDRKKGKFDFFRWCYKELSIYGTDYDRPIYILAMSTIAFILYYYTIITARWGEPQSGIDVAVLSQSAHFALKQVIMPFWSLRDMTPILPIGEFDGLLMFLALIQSSISTASIALLILAIRWKLKRG